MTAPLLEVEGLCAAFPVGGGLRPKRLRAARDVGFTLDRGEIVALVGESGSGKSTIGKLICRLVPATGGAIRLDGEDVLRTQPRGATTAYRRRVQMIFQDPFASLNPAHTVLYHLARPLLLHGRATRTTVRDAARRLLEDVGLDPAESYLDAWPHALSGGQRQRVAIARALAVEPDLLVADEPTSMLDVSVRMEVLRLLARLRDERGLAILFVTHDLGAARWLADRVIVLYAGTVMEDAPAEAITSAPAHPYAKLLVAAVPRPGGDVEAPLPAASGRPVLVDPPDACPFAPRCPQARAECTAALPSLRPGPDGRKVRCVLFPEAP